MVSRRRAHLCLPLAWRQDGRGLSQRFLQALVLASCRFGRFDKNGFGSHNVSVVGRTSTRFRHQVLQPGFRIHQPLGMDT
jgi:hypothetical protein